MTRWIAIAMLVLAAQRASAQPAPEEPNKPASAAELYEAGKRHFDITEYQAAIAAWKQAYLLSSEPLLLFNIAQAYRLSGDCAQANRFYLNYKRVAPKPTNRRELDEAMAKCAGIEPATGDPTSPPPQPPQPPGPDKPGPEPQGPPPETPAEDRGKYFRIAGIAAVAVGGAAAIGAVVSALDAGNKADDVRRQPQGTTWNPTLAKVEQDGRAAETRARIFAAVGIAAVAAGATLWWVGRSRSRVQVDVGVARGGGEVSLSCAF